MTIEEIKESAKVMEAYANGKKIQIQNYDKTWNDCPSPVFNWGAFKYRIKPDPKYRPFKTKEECWTEMHKHHDFGWIKDIVRDEIVQIMRISDEMLNILDYTISPYAFGLAFQTFVFTDGEPFGVKEE